MYLKLKLKLKLKLTLPSQFLDYIWLFWLCSLFGMVGTTNAVNAVNLVNAVNDAIAQNKHSKFNLQIDTEQSQRFKYFENLDFFENLKDNLELEGCNESDLEETDFENNIRLSVCLQTPPFGLFPLTPLPPCVFDPYFHSLPAVQPFTPNSDWNQLRDTARTVRPSEIQSLAHQNNDIPESHEEHEEKEVEKKEQEGKVKEQEDKPFKRRGRKCIAKSNLRKHVCLQCDRSFGRKEHLNRHLRSHSQDKFICEFCGTKMSRKDNLIAHQRSIHNYQGLVQAEKQDHKTRNVANTKRKRHDSTIE